MLDSNNRRQFAIAKILRNLVKKEFKGKLKEFPYINF